MWLSSTKFFLNPLILSFLSFCKEVPTVLLQRKCSPDIHFCFLLILPQHVKHEVLLPPTLGPNSSLGLDYTLPKIPFVLLLRTQFLGLRLNISARSLCRGSMMGPVMPLCCLSPLPVYFTYHTAPTLSLFTACLFYYAYKMIRKSCLFNS